MISIVIVNWNTRDLLEQCLSSILTFSPAEPIEIIVVDNASSDQSAEMVEQRFPSLKLIRTERNLGYAAGNNLGIRASSGDLVLTLNPDTRFFDDSLSRAAAELRNLPTCDVLAIKLLNEDGTHQRSVRGFPTPANICFEICGLGALFPMSKLFGAYRQSWFDYTKSQAAEQPMGTFLLFRKEMLDKTGLFDEQFPIFFNEVDLLKKTQSMGFGIRYFADAGVYHLGGASTRQVKKPMIWESHRSLIRYLKKWHSSFLLAPLLWLLFGLIWVGAFVRARGVYAGFRA